jgi:hypothetical protein
MDQPDRSAHKGAKQKARIGRDPDAISASHSAQIDATGLGVVKGQIVRLEEISRSIVAAPRFIEVLAQTRTS